jgi:hypothetical protein
MLNLKDKVASISPSESGDQGHASGLVSLRFLYGFYFLTIRHPGSIDLKMGARKG